MTVPYPTAMRDLPKVRQSLLANFNSCGLATRWDLEMGQGWSTHRAAGGTIMHRAIAQCLRELEENGEPVMPPELAMRIFDDVQRQNDVPLQGAGMGDAMVQAPAHELADMRVAVRTWAMNAPAWDTDLFAGIERRFDVPILYPDGAGGMVERIFTTQPDLVLLSADGEHAQPWDWKSSWGLPAETQKDDADDKADALGYFQQRATALVLFKTFPRLQTVSPREAYPRWMGSTGKAHHQTGKPINPYRDAVIYRYELPEIELLFSSLMERFDRSYEAQVWTPSPGTHCSYCLNAPACTIPRQARGEGAIESAEHAEEVAGLVEVWGAQKKQATAQLRTWSKAHGDVRVATPKGTKVYGPVLRQETSKPSRAQVEAAIAAGQNPADLYVTKDVQKFTVHAVDEEHPHVAAVRAEMAV